MYHRKAYLQIIFLLSIILIFIFSRCQTPRLEEDPALDREKSVPVAKRIDYQQSMENIAKHRSTIYEPTAKYRWLFLSSLQQYHMMMDRYHFSQYYAAKRHPNIEAVLWGLNFPGYDSSNNIIGNIRERFGSENYFDIIYVLAGGYGTKDVRSASRYTPIMVREHECWGYRCLPAIIDQNITLMLQTYAYEIDLYHTSFSYNRVMIHSPTSAEPLVYYPPMVLKTDRPPVRDIDLLVVGARNSFIYPLRTRLGEMVQKGRIKNSYLQAHPGYRLSNSTLEQTEGQMHAYAALLRRAKIVIVDSARYGHAFSKYMEVALSGCLIIGDIPAEREDEFRQFVVEISMNMTDAQILSIIDYWIRHDDERQKRAYIGQQIVLNSYTWDHNIDLSIQALVRYRRGEYGIYHRYPYSLRCVPFDNTYVDEATASKWCKSGLKGLPRRTLCECNETTINYMNEEPDLDNWRHLTVQINPNNPHMYLIPNTLLTYCDSYPIIADYARRTSSGTACRCQGSRTSSEYVKVCYVSNTILSISRHLAYVDSKQKKILQISSKT